MSDLLTEGQLVTVTRASGQTSQQIVGQVVGQLDGWVLARPGSVLDLTRAQRKAAEAR